MPEAEVHEELQRLADSIGDALGSRRVATAESCTAGAVAQALATGDGASQWLLGGVVSYHRDVKYEVLGVPRGPVVNAPAAEAMARGVCRVLGADVSVAITGAAGPDGQDGAEPGTVFLAFAGRDDGTGDARVDVEEHHFPGSPAEVCFAATKAALEGLATRLGGGWPRDGAATQGEDRPAAARP
jgi:nicotinamide-nucleotide amidase